RLEAVALDRAVVNEQVLARVIGRDEAIALVVAEPLHGSCCHVFPPGRSCAAKRGRCKSNNYERGHYFAGRVPGRTLSLAAGCVEMSSADGADGRSPLATSVQG